MHVQFVQNMMSGGDTLESNSNFHSMKYSIAKLLQFFTARPLLQFQAGNDAHLALSDTPDTSVTTYEVVIGGWKNGRSVIRKCIGCNPA